MAPFKLNKKNFLTRSLLKAFLKLAIEINTMLTPLISRAIKIYDGPNLAIVPYVEKGFILDRIIDHPEMRCKEFVFINQDTLEIKEALSVMLRLLVSNEQYRSFGNKKIVITHIGGLVDLDDNHSKLAVVNLHPNIVLDNDVSFSRYYGKVKDQIKSSYHNHYGFEIPLYFYVKVWNADHLMNRKILYNSQTSEIIRKGAALKKLLTRSYSTKTTNYDSLKSITPLKKLQTAPKPFYTMDIETINRNGVQEPFIISFSSGKDSQVFHNFDLKTLWLDFFTYLFTHLKNKNNTIFLHNLGGFDGIFLHKYVSLMFKDVDCVIDEFNNYISIKIIFDGRTYTFKDSLRLFPVSLNDLCKVFGVKGKSSEYISDWNDLDYLKSNTSIIQNLLDYARQDVLCLHEALTKAQSNFLSKYNVDITSVVSLPSLALRIFRLKYLKHNIPILNHINDEYVRRSYYGGSVDIYKSYARDAYYYDINSLYPSAMLEYMPMKCIEVLDSDYFDLDDLGDFFGFMEIDIECPEHIQTPILPFKQDGRTIFPHGVITGVYFSEEVKEAIKLGYKLLKVHTARRYSGNYIFESYVNEMYNLKASSTGPERWIAKLLLNSLYGIFGRKQETLKTVIINNSMLSDYLATFLVKTIIPIDEDKSILLMVDN